MPDRPAAAKSRSDDERVLGMLRMRDEGVNSPQIGRAFGMTAEAVRVLLRRVDRDLAASEAAG